MKILIYPIIFLTLLYANSEDLIKEYKTMFEKISEQRVGLDDSEIARVKSPFISTSKEKVKTKKVKKISLSLEAIFGNKVMINGNWYKLYSKVGEFKIVGIKDDTVLLKSENEITKLKLRKKNEFISIK